jgi:hypothetical protein
MTKSKTSKKRAQIKAQETNTTTDTPVCFIISPIGAEGSERYKKFKEVLDYLIKPAIKNSGYNFEVIRADDIERAGSFIKDILTSLLDSFVVIADLSEQNPNVFYELGVRHALSPRTILIAQSIDDIPSDLREYRTIVYETTLSGAAAFSSRLSNFLKQIFEDQHRSDNPVLDRLQSIIEGKTVRLENDNAELKRQISNLLKKGVPEANSNSEESVQKRVDRVLKVMGAERNLTGEFYREAEEGGDEEFELPTDEGNFRLYTILEEDTGLYEYYSDYIFVSVPSESTTVERELADIRVLMGLCSKGQDVECQFIIATNEDLSQKVKQITKAFDKMKMYLKPDQRNNFTLELWDKNGLQAKEIELGIRIDL